MALGNQAQAARRRRKGEALAHPRRAARPRAAQEGLGKAGAAGQLGHLGGTRPFVGHADRHRVAALGDLDGRHHQLGKAQAPEAPVQRHPAGHRARHGDGAPAARGDRRVAIVRATQALRRRPAGVQAVQLRTVPDQREGVRAQAVAAGLDQGHAGRRGDGGVHRVATLLQHAQAGLRRQRVAGRHHIAREHRAALARVGVGPVEAHGQRTAGSWRSARTAPSPSAAPNLFARRSATFSCGV
jgi:hypothetical protein